MLNDPYIVSNLIVELRSLLTPYIETNTKISGKCILEIFGFPIDLFDRLVPPKILIIPSKSNDVQFYIIFILQNSLLFNAYFLITFG